MSARLLRAVLAAPALALVLTVAGATSASAAPGASATSLVDGGQIDAGVVAADDGGDGGDDGTPDLGTNPFIPEDQNLGDCVSSMPRPNCGSRAHGGTGQALTFAVLMLGMAFIGWRIFRAVRRAERARDPDDNGTNASPTGDSTAPGRGARTRSR